MKNFFICFFTILFFSVIVCGAIYACCLNKDKQYSFFHKEGLYVFEFSLNGNLKLSPYVANGLESVETIAKNNNALFAINTGFFDAANKKTVSYIYQNDICLANPNNNENLLNNKILFQNFDRILNRTELRLYECKNKIVADIVQHNDILKSGCKLLHSTQAGPMFFPKNTMEEEFFVQFKNNTAVRDSVSLLIKKPRSFVGIKVDKLFFFITDENTSLTVYELIEKIKPYGLEKVMGFDGGGSVSMYVNDEKTDFYYSAEKGGISRPIKSALIIK